ncbi:hypothetical protein [Parasphaerochaeta coccoides]|uniref:Alginate export domain-containing protein n=1 Tax=Parasphaerochaeta coccoides (strain ATCC BAA-1237 / DSM 17374 / SPN1) TaxID=760011 RepID=F4GIS6_PARC1|nr:hypothetical protein [Parasphaerochaeta coccoides]AEC02694.1 hypothetical protein Spico_1491 [Parasphaerochaeta coccoides DSM 17374]
MKKKIIVGIVLLTVVLSGLYASDFHFVFGDLDQHPEIVGGFLPSYFNSGAGYTGLSLNEGDVTEFQFLAGAGYIQNKLWQSDVNGTHGYLLDSPLTYDVLRFDWNLRFRQGFGTSWVPDTDLITAYVSYNGRFEDSRDSIVKGKDRKMWGTDSPVLSIGNALDQLDNPYDIYEYLTPDETTGKRSHLGTSFSIGATLNMMDERKLNQDGLLVKVQLDWAPRALNSALSGVADYYSAYINAVAGKTLYSLYDGDDHVFSITLVDRANVAWIDGKVVPAYAQRPFSLGRKVRGFTTASYNRQFTAVNNFDIRLSGPEPVIAGIFPRVNIFFDAGIAAGNTLHTNRGGAADFLASTGAQVTVSFFDFIDLGYQVAYLIKGDNYVNGSDSRIATSVTFFLDF